MYRRLKNLIAATALVTLPMLGGQALAQTAEPACQDLDLAAPQVAHVGPHAPLQVAHFGPHAPLQVAHFGPHVPLQVARLDVLHAGSLRGGDYGV